MKITWLLVVIKVKLFKISKINNIKHAMDINKTKEIYVNIKNAVYELEQHIKESEKKEERIIETNERPPAGIRTSGTNQSHNHWISGLRTQSWWRRTNNY